MRQSDVALQPRAEGDPITEHCVICGAAVQQMIFRGSGVCGERDRKIRDDVAPFDRRWYHTAAKNLRNHFGHEVRFSLPDPWMVFEGVIGHVNFGEEDDIIGIVLEQGYTRMTAPSNLMGREPETIEDQQFATELMPYKVVEVRRCK